MDVKNVVLNNLKKGTFLLWDLEQGLEEFIERKAPLQEGYVRLVLDVTKLREAAFFGGRLGYKLLDSAVRGGVVMIVVNGEVEIMPLREVMQDVPRGWDFFRLGD